MPTLVLVGDADIADVFAYSGAIEAAVPLASFEVWKDTGHLVQIQKPVELVARFNRFFSLATREEVDLAERKLAIYNGQYTCFNGPCSVTLRDKHLVFEISGEPHYWLFAASETKFFLHTDETEIEFHKRASGNVGEMVIHDRGGSVFRCVRVEGGSR